jgi:flagella basal body P-ring formation protein FlgA
MRQTPVFGLGILLSLAIGSKAMAGPDREDPSAVAAAVKQSVAATTAADSTITLGPVAGAAYMQACGAPLAVTVSGTAPYEEANVHCAQPDWTLYVAVTVAEDQGVAVAARPIAAGAQIEPGDIKIVQEPVSLFAGRQVYYNTADLIGAVAVMGLSPGTILTSSGISQKVIVQAGQSASVTVYSGGLTLTIDAIADQTGHAGDSILMTNPSSGQRFHVLVGRDGLSVDLH